MSPTTKLYFFPRCRKGIYVYLKRLNGADSNVSLFFFFFFFSAPRIQQVNLSSPWAVEMSKRTLSTVPYKRYRFVSTSQPAFPQLAKQPRDSSGRKRQASGRGKRLELQIKGASVK